MKKCTKCNELRQETDYYIANKTKGTRKIICKYCCQLKIKQDRIANPESWKKIEARRKKKWAEKYRDRCRDSRLKYEYGIDSVTYDEMLKHQDNVCAICLQPETKLHKVTGSLKRLAVDHCHVTGKVRGLLCFDCNSSLGKFKDSIDNLQRAIEYLNKNKE